MAKKEIKHDNPMDALTFKSPEGKGAGVELSNQMAPKENETTYQGIFSGIYCGLGAGLGSIIGGFYMNINRQCICSDLQLSQQHLV
ncbi:hypothetical protein DICPUDRAFT_148970 [Dictyostelium purpureum]|uniref:Major facilitator superfamily associated domain-containing protein n=1 Tax=Dictyostelium purpureum TaxID=5786 RepID=F0ZCG9_DICPU|nr:uncharacterized protein DICPUDRAFT_148970 [Dictyostelium purpureum]EGC38342.1 hypothetical protein DICPUDRAFT_148970 [Dictyostelium purpureum]|eukprot:XP_003285099.1 hypothetical protein DICPUDRAFT_148970 [Dictyostelium purpureum]